MEPADINKAAITTNFELYEFVKMPFHLCNAAPTFQWFIDQVLCELPFCYGYTDDVLIVSATPEEHKEHLWQTFDRLKDYGIIISLNKCEHGTIKWREWLMHLIDVDVNTHHN